MGECVRGGGGVLCFDSCVVVLVICVLVFVCFVLCSFHCFVDVYLFSFVLSVLV